MFEYLVKQRIEMVRAVNINPEDMTESLNKLGAQGWELVTVIQATPYQSHTETYYFKRPKPG